VFVLQGAAYTDLARETSGLRLRPPFAGAMTSTAMRLHWAIGLIGPALCANPEGGFSR
jgi:hypothetical protein